jgi:hypothetical protein
VANESKPPRTIALIVSAIRNLRELPSFGLAIVRFTETESTPGALMKADMFAFGEALRAVTRLHGAELPP